MKSPAMIAVAVLISLELVWAADGPKPSSVPAQSAGSNVPAPATGPGSAPAGKFVHPGIYHNARTAASGFSPLMPSKPR
jgi:hypothetical protein